MQKKQGRTFLDLHLVSNKLLLLASYLILSLYYVTLKKRIQQATPRLFRAVDKDRRHILHGVRGRGRINCRSGELFKVRDNRLKGMP